MASFNCENCKAPTNKLIIPRDSKGDGKLRCPSCYNRSSSYRPTYLHQPMEGSTSRGLTEAKSRIIGNRMVSPDDRMTVIDRRTGKETQY